MEIRFYNTLTRRVERFEPLQPPAVAMYNCGPTVYDYAHIGNFRAFVMADVLRRFLELVGYRVHQVMNITDVGHMTDDQLADGGGEDKMQVALRRMASAKKSGAVSDDAVADPKDPYQVAGYFTKAFIQDAQRLNLAIAREYPQQMPHATGHINQMQAMIATLIEKGHAYIADDGAVYFSVASFPAYGTLSGNTLDQIRGGAGGRVLHEHQASKRHPADFLLWKPDDSHVMKWDSPWGTGYPGWHIECSAMAKAVLGRDTIDIHTGGEDNIFPHHECEIAQSTGATGKPLANYWLHARFLLVDGQKMSKSKGNFFTVRDLLQGTATGKPIDPTVIRYELLKAHYRSNANFTSKGLDDSASAIGRLRRAYADWQGKTGDRFEARHVADQRSDVDSWPPVVRAFADALADDLNISEALGALFSWLKGAHPDPHASLTALVTMNHVLGLDLESPQDQGDESGVTSLCRAIDDARSQKDYAEADRLRQQLIDAGYEVHTTQQGTTARRMLMS